MQKIMFNDRYGLTGAVLRGDKTMTRRIIPPIEVDWNRRGRVTLPVGGFEHGVLKMDVSGILHDASPLDYPAPAKYQPKYKVGEEVAVAQRYSELSWDKAFYDMLCSMCDCKNHELPQYKFAGWDNKMFVNADLMPHRIRITGIKVERLQDISDEDCMKEGITRKVSSLDGGWNYHITDAVFVTPRAAFAALINKVSGRGTWEKNPWVFAYEFELTR